MSTNSSGTIHGFPTELLIRIFARLQVTDLLSAQHTCRRFYDAISGSASLQYFLLTEVNLLEDLSPPVYSLDDRVALLKRHETAWNNLELNIYAKFVTIEDSHESHSYCYILQDGYLIYKVVDTARGVYGYIDLYSRFALPNAEAPWTHIPLAASIYILSDIVFAVDHNLAVAIRSLTSNIIPSISSYSDSRQAWFPVATFLQFTTGVSHPLSLVTSVALPREPEVKLFGDYLLVTGNNESPGWRVFSAISWKMGTRTEVSGTFEPHRVIQSLRRDP